jgi:hypothetical protein
MNLHLLEGDIHLLDLRTRMPFRYGIATMTETPHAFVRLRVAVGGRPAVGVAADHLPPKWFTKDPNRPVADEVAEMARVVEHAVGMAAGIRAASAFDAWRQVHEAQAAWGRAEGLPPLLTQFGTSLVERALIDAVCRTARRPFHELLRDDAFGIRLGDIHPVLAGRRTAGLLPERPPLPRVQARHTVGLSDPLTDADVAPEERCDDGLPQSLSACIRAYGLRHFKVKVSGNLERDRERLRLFAEVVRADAPARGGVLVSLDGNEQFRSLADFRSFWEGLCGDPALRPFPGPVVYVEQPLHRDVALDPAVARFVDWPNRPPVIIDESDAELDSFPRALALGYTGTSHKNCKGVFKSVANVCLLCWHVARGNPLVSISGEDLANIGPVALLQDLAVCAALGIHSVERNGHHYFAGLSMFPASVQRQVLAAHGDLYHPSRDGWPTLAIRGGSLAAQSLNAAPFGVGFDLDVDSFPALAEWRRAHTL